ncbi:prophage tail gpP-like protein [Agrobacterium larrymoorei]|uniref:Prophage tail gpP-like protein n=1 Tax=Agrobacterium larrymoorei TaxID=160699 RepID=A0AAJ2BNL4_9HYPH|nr:Mu P family protein [Agrobacterium larrymoorei]MDR6102800.1 prophage tail gpP-like protein [Agrobacterium larrymoorei]
MAKKKRITLLIDGEQYDQWLSGEVTRDLKDFSGSFSFTFRDGLRSMRSMKYASAGSPYKLRPGPEVIIRIDGRTVLKGWLEKVRPEISDRQASVTISGRDKSGDLIDCAAMKDVAEFNNVKLEEAAKRIVAPFGMSVRSEIDTGEPFSRYSIDLAETGFSAIEKGARSRHALVLSDGVGGVVITRTGATRAPAHIVLPGNVLSSGAEYSHENRFSETTVRGQGEKAGKERGKGKLDVTAEPIGAGDRNQSGGSATEQERRGTAATGRAKDDEITRYRPIVHLARSKADSVSAQDEADWRSRTARAESEEMTYSVKGFVANGQLWAVNQLAYVSDAFQDVERDMLISRTRFVEDSAGAITELSVVSPEAFDKGPVGDRRKNKSSKAGKKAAGGGALDGTASAL